MPYHSARPFLLSPAFILLALSVQAQTYIFGRADFAVGNFPTSVAPGDFNGDGLTDLIVTNSGDNTVSVLLGKTDGTFAPQVISTTGPEPIAVVTGDFNGDGNLDIAVANGNCTPGKFGPLCSSSTVSILLGNGDGTFQPHIDYGVGTLPSSLLVADFNGDGKLDLAVTNAVDGTVSILLGNGDGTFQPQVVYATAGASNWQSVVVGDFNGDGKPDLAVSCVSVVSVLLGNGDGTFRTHIDSGAGGISLAAGDFNHDGKLDLAVSGTVTGLGSVLLGNGDGTFILTNQYPGGASVSVNDLNGDGKLDLVVAEVGNQNFSISVMLGNGDGTFQNAVQYGTAYFPFGVVLADLNGDGRLDLAVADSGCTIVTLVMNPCTGQQNPPGAISVLLGFGDGTFVGKTDYGVGGGPLAITTADFNNDGHPDLVTANQGADSVSVLLGNGNGTFQPQVTYPVGLLPLSVATGDFRNSGNLDLVTANETCPNTLPCNPGTASVLLGNGNGTFQPHVDYGVGLVPYSLAVGDFRGNGKLDLAVANNGSASVSILLGNGDGTFQPQVGYLTASYPSQIATGDFNQDGKLDLAITASGAGGVVSILLGNGDGTFRSHIDYPGGSFAIATGDFNGDGKLDLATGGNQSVSILLGNGDGTFQAPVTYQLMSQFGAVSSIAVTDFNGDSKPDLAINTESTEFLIMLGNGDGTFQQPIQYVLANEISFSLTVDDFNGDGTPDWAAADANTGTVGVMLSAAFKAISPGSLNFGSQGVGTTGAVQSITISNPTNVKIKISSIAATGNFAQTNDCSAGLTPGANCTVNVTFSPTSAGPESGSIDLTDNTRISPLAIALTGTGVNGSFVTPYPSRMNFPPEAVGTPSLPHVVNLVNTGNAPLSVTAINITGTNLSDFTQTNNCPSSLTTGSSCNVNVTFTPIASGSRIADLAISDTASGSPQTVPLVGTGLGPVATLNPNSLTFTSQGVGTTSAAQTVTLTNTGNAQLNITQIAASGDFAETNTCNTSLGPGSNCQITVTFTPTAAGNRSGGVTISDNGRGSPQTIVLSGTGLPAPDFTIAAASGSPASQTITAGQIANFSLVLTPVGSFTGTVNVSCVIAPTVTPAPTCNAPSSLQISGSGSQSVSVSVGTTAPVTTSVLPNLGVPATDSPLLWTSISLGAVWLYARRRKRLLAFSLSIVVVSSIWLFACGGSSSHTTPGTPAGTYTATVTATSGNLDHNTVLQVVVQ